MMLQLRGTRLVSKFVERTIVKHALLADNLQKLCFWFKSLSCLYITLIMAWWHHW